MPSFKSYATAIPFGPSGRAKRMDGGSAASGFTTEVEGSLVGATTGAAVGCTAGPGCEEASPGAAGAAVIIRPAQAASINTNPTSTNANNDLDIARSPFFLGASDFHGASMKATSAPISSSLRLSFGIYVLGLMLAGSSSHL